MAQRLSLAMIARNEENCIEQALLSVHKHVDEMVFIDTGSTDKTFEICQAWGRAVRLSCDFLDFDFAEWKTAVSRMCRSEYILLLDADESVTGAEHLRTAVQWLYENRSEKDAVSFPRRRWLDREMTQRVEESAWPDWQARLYRNDPQIRWSGALHEKLNGAHYKMLEPVVIEHFQDVYGLAGPERATRRMEQRRILAQKAGVKVEGSDEALALAMRNVKAKADLVVRAPSDVEIRQTVEHVRNHPPFTGRPE